jgi:hypothetical protein
MVVLTGFLFLPSIDFSPSSTHHSINFTYHTIMPSLPDDDRTFELSELDKNNRQIGSVRVPYSEHSLQKRTEYTDALSQGNPAMVTAKFFEYQFSVSTDVKNYLDNRRNNSRAGTNAPPSAGLPTDNNSTQRPPTAGSENPSVSGPARPPPKQD